MSIEEVREGISTEDGRTAIAEQIIQVCEPGFRTLVHYLAIGASIAMFANDDEFSDHGDALLKEQLKHVMAGYMTWNGVETDDLDKEQTDLLAQKVFDLGVDRVNGIMGSLAEEVREDQK